MSELKDSALLAAEEIALLACDTSTEGMILSHPTGLQFIDSISSIIHKHFPVALPVSGEIPTPRTDAMAFDVTDEGNIRRRPAGLYCDSSDVRQLERELAEAKTKCGHQHQLLRSVFYAAEFYKNDNGYRLNKLMSCSDNGKEVLLELDERNKLQAELATERAAREKAECEVRALRPPAMPGYYSELEMHRMKSRAESAEQELKEYIAKTDPFLACVDPTQETPHCGKCMVCLGVRAEAAEAKAGDVARALSDVMELIDSGYLVRDTSKDGEPGWAIKQLEPCRKLQQAAAALASAPAEKPCNHVAGSDGESVGCIHCGKTAEELSAESVNRDKISLTLTKRSDDIHCQLTGHPETRDCGKTILEAIGRWVVTHGRGLGISVDHTQIAAMSAHSVSYEQEREQLAKKIGDMSEERE